MHLPPRGEGGRLADGLAAHPGRSSHRMPPGAITFLPQIKEVPYVGRI
jgi:hypothetical protein